MEFVQLDVQASTSDAATAPADFSIDYSDDGIAWTTVSTQSGLAWTAGEIKRFTWASAGAHAYWRIRVSATAGSNTAALAGVAFYAPGETLSHTEHWGQAILMGQGTSGTDQIFVGMQIYEDPNFPYFNIALRGMVDFAQAEPFWNQPGVSPETYVYLDNTSMTYWFVANGRRFTGVAKVASSVYEAWYGGFILPYATPAQFPYPIAVGGNGGVLARNFTNTNVEHRNFPDPGVGCLYVRLTDGAWNEFRNWEGTTSKNGRDERNIWPFKDTENKQNAFFTLLREQPDGSVMPFATVLHSIGGSPSRALWGELDGIYAVSGFNVNAEDTVQINGIDHLAVGNVFRASDVDHWLLKLE